MPGPLSPLTNNRPRVLSLAAARVLARAADGKIDLRKPYTTKNRRTKKQPKLGTRYALVYHDYTKTDAGQRMLPLAPGLLDRLRAHARNQEEERALLGERWTPNDLVFPSETGGPLNPPNLHRHFDVVRACAGLEDMRIHDLRHTCATLLGERTSDRVIAAILGHTPGTVTARYARVTLSQMREALDALYAALTGAD